MHTPEELAERKAERTGIGCFVTLASAIAAIAFVVAMDLRYDDGLSSYGNPAFEKRAAARHYSGPRGVAAEWFWSNLRADDAWHSEKYAQLRGGRALTPLIYLGLTENPKLERLIKNPMG